MPLTSDQQAALSAALNRLQNFYDGDHAYNPATYPGAFRQGGSVVNFYPALKDVATVMQLASVLVADATAASGASPKALRVDSAQPFQPGERGQARSNLKLPASTYVYSSGNSSLTKDDVGTVFYVDSTQTISIPLLSDCVVGDTIEFWVAAGTLTLAQPAGNSNPIGVPGGGSGQTVALGAGAYTLKRHDSAWRLHTPPNTAVQRTGDTMTGDLVISKPAGFAGVRMTVPGKSDHFWRAIDNGRMQLCDGGQTVEYLSVGTDGSVSTRQFGDLNSRIENRGSAWADNAANRSVSNLRWVYAGQKLCYEQPNTGGFIEPAGPHAMECGYWTFIVNDGSGNGAPFGKRWRVLQFYTANQGWVTVGAAS